MLQQRPGWIFHCQLPRPVRCSPSKLQWNIDVKSLDSWVSHLSWWYHKEAINSVREHQTYHRHIIGYEDITESTCLESTVPSCEASHHRFPRKFARPIHLPAALASPLALFISHGGQLKMAPASLFLWWHCEYANTLDLCIITSSGTICCWLVDLPCVCFLMVFSCIWVMYWCINTVIII